MDNITIRHIAFQEINNKYSYRTNMHNTYNFQYTNKSFNKYYFNYIS